MKKNLLLILLSISGFSFGQTNFTSSNFPSLVGYWNFENNNNLNQAQIGNPLANQGVFTQVTGPTATDFAVRKLKGNYFTCTHGILPLNINQYSVMIDFKVSTTSLWYSFLQTNPLNNDDGDLFINTSGKIGVADLGYSATSIIPNEWYRLIITVDAGNSVKIYLDGQQFNGGAPSTLNGRFSLQNVLLLLADDDGEDNQMDVASMGIFNKTLSAAEVFAAGSLHLNTPTLPDFKPYLQTATPSSIFISWDSNDLAQNPEIKYGTSTSSLNQTQAGTWEQISGSYNWHTVQLAGLSPDTEYYYQCYNGAFASQIYSFRTPTLRSAIGQHIRMVVLGDNRTDIAKTTQNVQQIKSKLVELYGTKFYNSVDLILHCGDIVTDGTKISQYTNEFFTPYAPLTASIPTMISIGNHEGDSNNFYKYMKYEGLTDGFPAPHSYNEKFYNYNYGNTQIVAVNGNANYKLADQISWLDSRLQESNADANIDFVFSFLHHPGHSEIWPDGNEVFVQNSIIPKLTQYPKNAFIFYGHSHNYERGSADIPTGTHDMYLELTGGAGAALDRWGMYGNQTDYPEIKVSKDIYCWTLIDIDVDNKSFNAKTFSFGNSNRPAINELVDEFHLNLNQAAPETPVATGLENLTTLTASTMVGVDVAQTCQFQISTVSGNYTTPLISKEQDKYNIYNDTRAPNWTPINKNAALNISKLDASTYGLTTGQTYFYRVRYRDENLKWSAWSTEKSFVYNTLATSIYKNESKYGLKVYPNPVTSSSKISFEMPYASSDAKIQLIDMTGKVLETIFKGKLEQGLQTISLENKNKISSGIYFVKLSFDNTTETFEIAVN